MSHRTTGDKPHGRHGPPVTRADPLTDARVDDTPPDGTTPAIVPDASTDPLCARYHRAITGQAGSFGNAQSRGIPSSSPE